MKAKRKSGKVAINSLGNNFKKKVSCKLIGLESSQY